MPITEMLLSLLLLLLLQARAGLTVGLVVDAVELKRRERHVAASTAETILVITLAKNGEETLVKSLSTSVADSAQSTLVAIRHGWWAIHLAFVLHELLGNKLVAVIAAEALGVTHLAHDHHGVSKNGLATDTADVLWVLATVALLTSKATIGETTEGLKRNLAARANKAFLVVHLVLKAQECSNNRLAATSAQSGTLILSSRAWWLRL